MKLSTAKLFKVAVITIVCACVVFVAQVVMHKVGFLHEAIVGSPSQPSSAVTLQWPEAKIELLPLKSQPLSTAELHISLNQ